MEKKNSPGLNIAIVVCAVVAIVGIGLWIYQLLMGFGNTNMRNLDSWGLYIVNFTFMIGLSAGGLIISSVPRAFGIEGFGGISKIAIWLSIVCTVLAAVFIIIDLGQPLRIWEMIAQGNFMSPLIWDFVVIFTYLVLSIVYLIATLKYEKGKGSERNLRVISILALTVAILVHSVTAWIFGLQAAHGFWNTALLAPWFISSALVSGLALVLITIIILRKVGYLSLDQKYLIKMGRLLAVFLIVDLYFFGCDLLTAGYSGKADDSGLVAMLTTGYLAPFFWCEVGGGIVAAILMFNPKTRTPGFVMLASVLAVVGILCKRFQLVLGGFSIRNIDFPTLSSGDAVQGMGASWMTIFNSFTYFPSPLELGITLGVLALGVLGILLGIKLLPLKSEK